MADSLSYDEGPGRISFTGGHSAHSIRLRTQAKLEPNEYVERTRRIQLNDLENLPFFLFAGLLFVTTDPPLLLTQGLLYGYVVSRLLHFFAYFTARTHDVRATFWTIGSLILIFITLWPLFLALR